MADKKNKENQPLEKCFSFIITEKKDKVEKNRQIVRSKGPSGGKANKK